MHPKISEGQDAKTLTAEAEALTENGWALDDQEMGFQKTFHFKTYTKALVSGAFGLPAAQAYSLRTFCSP